MKNENQVKAELAKLQEWLNSGNCTDPENTRPKIAMLKWVLLDSED